MAAFGRKLSFCPVKCVGDAASDHSDRVECALRSESMTSEETENEDHDDHDDGDDRNEGELVFNVNDERAPTVESRDANDDE